MMRQPVYVIQLNLTDQHYFFVSSVSSILVFHLNIVPFDNIAVVASILSLDPGLVQS